MAACRYRHDPADGLTAAKGWLAADALEVHHKFGDRLAADRCLAAAANLEAEPDYVADTGPLAVAEPDAVVEVAATADRYKADLEPESELATGQDYY